MAKSPIPKPQAPLVDDWSISSSDKLAMNAPHKIMESAQEHSGVMPENRQNDTHISSNDKIGKGHQVESPSEFSKKQTREFAAQDDEQISTVVRIERSNQLDVRTARLDMEKTRAQREGETQHDDTTDSKVNPFLFSLTDVARMGAIQVMAGGFDRMDFRMGIESYMQERPTVFQAQATFMPMQMMMEMSKAMLSSEGGGKLFINAEAANAMQAEMQAQMMANMVSFEMSMTFLPPPPSSLQTFSTTTFSTSTIQSFSTSESIVVFRPPEAPPAMMIVPISSTTTTTTPPNAIPVASNAFRTISEGASQISGLLTATDANNDALVFSTASAATYGALTFASSGSYMYQLNNALNAVDALGVNASLIENFNYSVSDGKGGSAAALLRVTIQGVNDAPVSVAGTKAATEDGSAVTGTLVATDVDSGDTRTYSVVTNGVRGSFTVTNASTGAYSYTINNALTAVQALALGATMTDTLAFRATDAQGATGDAEIVVTITGVNDAPVSVAGTKGATEDGSAVTGTLSVTDVDTGDTHTYSVITNGTYGSFVVTNASTGAYSYTINNAHASVQALAVGATMTDTLTFRATDNNSAVSNADVVVTITGVNDIATISGLITSASHNENTINSTAQILDSAVILADVDVADWNGGNLTIAYASGGGSEDQLTVQNQGVGAGQISVSGSTVYYEGNAIGTISTSGANGTSLVIDFNTADASITAVDALIQAITYQNTSHNPTSSRTLRATVNDGDGGTSSNYDITVTVSPEADSLTLTSGTDTFITGAEDDTFTTTEANFAAADTITANGGTDTLIFTNAANTTVAELANKTGIEVIQFNASNNTVVLSDAFVDAADSDSVELANNTRTITSLDVSDVNSLRTVVISGTGMVTLSAGSAITLKNGVNTNITMSSGVDTITGGTGSDTITVVEANFAATDTIAGGTGTDKIIFNNAATITSAELANKSAIEIIQFNGTGNSVVLSDAFVDAADSNSVELANSSNTITSLDVSDVNALRTVVIGGTGMVTLSAGGAVTSKDGVNTKITMSSGVDTITGGTGGDSFTVAEANFAATDTIIGGTGTDVLIFSNAATITSAELANKSGIERITFGGTGNSVVLSDAFVDAADSDSVELANSTNTITSLDVSDVNALRTVVIGGTGMVTLSTGGKVTLKDGVSTNITMSSGVDTITGGTGNDTITVAEANFAATDIIAGGTGSDVLDFSNAATITSAELANKSGIEFIWFGAAGNSVVLSDAFVDAADSDSVELNSSTAWTITSLDVSDVNALRTVVISGSAAVTFAAAGVVTMKAGSNVNITGSTGADTFKTTEAGFTSADVLAGGTGTDTLYFSDAATITSAELANKSAIEVIQFNGTGNSVVLSDAFVDAADSDSVELANSTNTITSLDVSNLNAARSAVIGGSGAVTLSAAGVVTMKAGVDVSITGSSGADTFKTTEAGFTSADTLAGGTGTDTLYFSDAATITSAELANKSAIEVIQFNGTGNSVVLSDAFVDAADSDSVELANSTNTITSLDVSDVNALRTVVIGGAGAVTLSAGGKVTLKDGVNTNITMSSGVDTITGGTGSDTITVAEANFAATDTISGGTGTDTLVFSNAATITSAELANKSAIEVIQFNGTGNSVVLSDAFVDAADSDSVELANSTNTITSLDVSNVNAARSVVIGGSGAVTFASGIAGVVTMKAGVDVNITGSSGADTFITTEAGFTSADTLAGGTGTDTLYFSDAATITSAELANKSAIEVIQFNGTGNSVVLSDAFVDAADSDSVELANSTNTITSLDVSAINAARSVVIGGSGAVTLSAAGVVTMKAGVDVSITGSSGADTFKTTEAGFTSADVLAGGAGTDILYFSDAATITGAELANKTGIDVIQFSVDGNSVNLDVPLADTFVDASDNDSLEIANSTYTVSLSVTEVYSPRVVVIGGTGMVTLSTSSTITLKDGVNTNITMSTSLDTITGGTGNDTITVANLNFAASDILSGGAGTDTLVFSNAAAITSAKLASKTGIDVIQFNGTGNTAVLSDAFVDAADSDSVELANSTNTITALDVSNVNSARSVVIGGAGAVTLSAAGVVTMKAGVDVNITGSSGADTFKTTEAGFTSADTLAGGAGNDTLVFTDAAAITSAELANKSAIEVIQFSVDGNTAVLSDAFVDAADSDIVELANSTYTITSLDTSNVNALRTVRIGGTGAVTLSNGSAVTLKDGVNTNITMSSGVDTITGGTGSDTITVAEANFAATDTISGGTGTDTIIFSDAATITSAELANKSAIEVIQFNGTGNSVVLSDAFVDAADSDSVELANSTNTITSLDVSNVNAARSVVIGGSGAVTFASGIAGVVTMKAGVDVNITGSSGNDTFKTTEAGFTSADVLAGGAGNDTLVFTDAAAITSAELANKSAIEVIQFNGTGNSVVLSDAFVDAADSDSVELANSTNTITSLDVSNLNAARSAVIGGSGAVTLSAAGILTMKAGVDVNITGSSGADTFITTEAGFTSADTLAGGTGTDTLYFSDAATITSAELANKSAIEVIQFNGTGNSVVLSDAFVDAADSDSVELANGTFNTITSLDVSNVNAARSVVIGGAGAVTLSAAGTVTMKAGVNVNITGSSGADTFITTDAGFTTSDLLIGGAGTDTLVFTDTATITFSELLDHTGIDVIQFNGTGNSVVIPNAFVLASDSVSIELANGANTITSLDVSSAGSNQVVIGGTGAVTLSTIGVVTMKAGVDVNITGSGSADTFKTTEAGFTADDILAGGGNADTLVFTDAATITSAELANKSSIEKIQFDGTGNSVVLSDAFVGSALSTLVTLQNGTNTITALDISAVTSVNYKVYIGGTGAVTLTAAATKLFLQAGVDTNVTVNATATTDNITGDTGNDTITTNEANFAAADVYSLNSGTDTLVFSDAATITSAELVSKSGIEVIQFNGTGNSVVLSDAFVNAAGSDSVELANSTNTITSLDVSNLNAARSAVIGGSGAVTLSAAGVVTMKAGVDVNITGSSGADTFKTTEAGFTSADTLAGGTGNDTLVFTDAAAITSAELANKSAIEVIQFSVDGNTAVLSDAFVDAADSDIVELANSTYTITSLDTSNVNVLRTVRIGGTGAVTLSNGSAVTLKDGVNTNITMSSGVDTITGGTGSDTITVAEANFAATDTIAGGTGTDTLVFSNAATITSAELANKSAIEVIQFNGTGNSVVLSDAFVDAADSDSVELANSTNTITSLDVSNLNAARSAVVGGSGAVTLSAAGVVTMKAGVDVSITGSSGADTFKTTEAGFTSADVLAGGAGTDTLYFSDAATITSAELANKSAIEVIQFNGTGNSVVLSDTFVDAADSDSVELANSTNTITSLDVSNLNSARSAVVGGSGAVTLSAAGVVTMKAGVDVNITGSSGADTFKTTEAGFTSADTLAGGTGNDTLVFTDAAAITSAELANKSAIEVIQFSVDGNTAVLSDAFVDAADSDIVELANSTYTITSLDTSNVNVLRTVRIGGTGAVTLSNGSAVTLKDGVNTNITMSSGVDTITGGTGSDTITVAEANFAATDTIAGGTGTDTLVFSNAATITSAELANKSAIEVIQFNGTGNSVVLSDAFVDAADSDVVELANSTNTITALDVSNVNTLRTVRIGGTGAVTLSAGGAVTLKDAVNTNITMSSGVDTITGGTGSDTITVAEANFAATDTISGGTGTDTVIFSDAATITAAELANKTGIEVIQFSANGNTVALSDAFVDAATGDSVEIANSTYTVSLDTSALIAPRVAVVGGTGAVTLSVGGAVTLKDGVNTNITMSSGVDTITGGTGSDTITVAEANFAATDTISGGTGTDTINFSNAATITTAELANKTGIEVIQLNANSTVALSDAFVDSATGDSVEIANSTYTVSLDTSALVAPRVAVIGGTGTVTLSAAGAVTSKDGVNTTIVGSSGNDTFTGGTGNDTLSGGRGVDTINGGGGADTLTGGYGGDTISGGAGNDIIYADNQAFSTSTFSNLKLWLDAGDINTDSSSYSDIATWANKATSTTVANATWVSNIYNDKPALAYTTMGRAGLFFDWSSGGERLSIPYNAELNGSNSSLFIIAEVEPQSVNRQVYSSGSGLPVGYTIEFDSDDDRVDLTANNTEFKGTAITDGSNALFSAAMSAGSLDFYMNAGLETTTAYTANASSDTLIGHASSGNQLGTISEIIVFDVTLDASQLASMHEYLAMKYNVTLSGQAAGLAADTLTGGTGADTFTWTNASYSSGDASARDVITDFNTGSGSYDANEGDKIDISALISVPYSALGNISFANLTNQLIWAQSGADTIVSIDYGGNNTADWSIKLSNFTATNLSFSNFTLSTNSGVGAALTSSTDTPTLTAGRDVIVTTEANFVAEDTLTASTGTDTLVFTDAATITTAELANKTGIELIQFNATGNTVALSDAFVDSATGDSVEIVNATYTVSLDSSALVGPRKVVIGGTGQVTLSAGGAVTLKDGIATNITMSSGVDTITGGTGDDTITVADANFAATDTIAGGAVNDDTLVFSDAATITAAELANKTGIEYIQFNGTGNSVVLSDAFVDASDNDSISLYNGTNTITSLDVSAVNAARTVIIGGTGAVTLSVAGVVTMRNGFNMNITGSSSDDTFKTVDLGFTANDVLAGGAGTDTLYFSNAANIASAELANKSAIEVIQFNGTGNVVVLSDAFVDAADSDSVELANGANTITSLNVNAVNALRTVVIGGTGAVTLSAGGAITLKNGVNTSITMSSGVDTITGGTGSDTITVAEANFAATDTIAGGTGTDKLIFSNAATITSAELANKSAIEVIQFNGTGNSVVLSDAFVDAADSNSVELANGANTITSLDVSDVNALRTVVIGGTGIVTLSAGGAVTLKDGVNATVTMSSGVDTITGGTGTDIIRVAEANFAATDTIAGGTGTDTIRFLDAAAITSAELANKSAIEIIQFIGTGNTVVLSDAFVDAADSDSVELLNSGNTITALDVSNVNAARSVVINGSGAVTLSAAGVVTAKAGATVSITGSSGNDTFKIADADFVIGNTLAGGAGTDTVYISDAATITSSDLANKSAIEVIQFNGTGNTVVLSDAFVGSATSTTVTLNNSANTITALDISAVTTAGNKVYIDGTGAVTLTAAATKLFLQDGVNTNVTVHTSATTDNITGGTGSDTLTTNEANFAAADVYAMGTGTDTLIFSDAATITSAELANKSAIEVIQFNGTGNSVVLSDAFVDAADSDSVELANGTNTITALDVSNVNAARSVVIGGSGAVTFSAAGAVTMKAGVDVSITGSGSGDTFKTTEAGFTSADTLAAGAGTDTLIFTDAAALTSAELANKSAIEVIQFDGTGNTAVLSDAFVSSAASTTVTFNNSTNTITALDISAVTTAGNKVYINGTGAVTLTAAATKLFLTDGVNTNVTVHTSATTDTITGGTGSDTLTTNEANFAAGDVYAMGTGTDTLVFSNAAAITSAELANKSAIEVIQFNGTGNSVVLSDAFVDAADSDSVELANSTNTITALDVSNVNTLRTVVIGGSGAVTFNAAGVVTMKAGVDVNITGNGSADTFKTTEAGFTSADTLAGGAGTDTLIFTDAAAITSAELANKSAIEVIQFNGTGNTVVLNDTFVASAAGNAVELANSTNTITALDLTGVTGDVTIGGTGAVTLSAASTVWLKNAVVNTITGSGGADTFKTLEASFASTDVLAGGAGSDTLYFSDAAAITSAELANKTAIEVIQFNGTGNTAVLSDAFVSSATSTTVTLSNGSNTITALDISAVTTAGNKVYINGTGAVTLTAAATKLFLTDGVNTNVTVNATATADTITGGTGDDTLTTNEANFAAGDVYAMGTGTDTLVFSNAATITSAELANKTAIEVIQFNGTGNSVVLSDAFVDASGTDIVTLENGTNTITALDVSNVNALRSVVIGGTGQVTMSAIGKVTLKDGVNTNITASTAGTDTILGGTGDDTVTIAETSFAAADTFTMGTGTDTLKFSNAAAITSAELANKTGIEVIQFTAGSTAVLSDAFVDASDTDIVTLENGANAITALDVSGVNALRSVVIGGTGVVTMSAIGKLTMKDGVNTSVTASTAGTDTIIGGTGDNTITIAEASFAAADTFTMGNGGQGVDRLIFSNLAAITAAELANKTGIEEIQFSNNNGATAVLTDAFVDSAANDTVELISSRTITSLDASAVNAARFVVIGGTGAVTLSAASTVVTLKTGVVNTITGSSGNDTFKTSDAAFLSTDVLAGGAGTDTLQFTDAASIASADLGNKTLWEAIQFDGTGNTVVLSDAFVVSSNTDIITLTNGANTITALDISAVSTSGTKVYINGTGAVTLTAAATKLFLQDGVNTNVTVHTSATTDTITGGTGSDTLTTNEVNFVAADVYAMGTGTDTLVFSNAAAITSAELANKTGIEVIQFNATGNTVVLSDAFVDAADSNSVELANGSNTITALDVSNLNALRTAVIGGSGTVTLSAAGVVTSKDGVNTTIVGSSGNDTITGGNFVDTIKGGGGADTLQGGDSLDTMYMGDGAGGGGTASAEVMRGGAGNDDLYVDVGDAGTDTVYGGTGHDTIYAAASGAADTLYGEIGNDIFVFVYGNNSDATVWGGTASGESPGAGSDSMLFGSVGALGGNWSLSSLVYSGTTGYTDSGSRITFNSEVTSGTAAMTDAGTTTIAFNEIDYIDYT